VNSRGGRGKSLRSERRQGGMAERQTPERMEECGKRNGGKKTIRGAEIAETENEEVMDFTGVRSGKGGGEKRIEEKWKEEKGGLTIDAKGVKGGEKKRKRTLER